MAHSQYKYKLIEPNEDIIEPYLDCYRELNDGKRLVVSYDPTSEGMTSDDMANHIKLTYPTIEDE
jgi:hypothetical protein